MFKWLKKLRSKKKTNTINLNNCMLNYPNLSSDHGMSIDLKIYFNGRNYSSRRVYTQHLIDTIYPHKGYFLQTELGNAASHCIHEILKNEREKEEHDK